MLREYATKNGFRIVQEYRDSETARSTGRKGFNAMLSYMEDHTECKVILVEKTDRLTRNMKDYAALDIEKRGIEIHFVRDNKVMSRNSSPSEHFIQEIELAQAAYISRNISAEARKGMRAKAEAGLYPSVAPMGYVNTSDANGVKIIETDSESAPLIQEVFEKYAAGGVAIADIAELLYEKGLRTKRGNRISTSTIHKLLRNPFYRGKFIWNGIEYQGKHETLISSALWFKVQDMLGERSVEKPRQTVQFAYTGLMKCGHCGCTITAERKKSKYSYYHCTGFKNGKHGEPNLREEKLTEQFSEALRALAIDSEIAEWLLDTVAASTLDKRERMEKTLERLYSRRERLQKRSELLYDDRLEGRISAMRYDEREALNRRELEEVDEKLSTVEIDSLEDPLEYAKGIIELTQSAQSLFLESPIEDRKPFLQDLLSNCTLRDSRINPTFAYPFGLIADTNALWKSSGAVSGDLSAVHSVWYPETNSNSQT